MASPDYYKTAAGTDVFAILNDEELFAFAKGNVLKYVIRAGRKPGEMAIKDLGKALDYLQVMVSILKTNNITDVSVEFCNSELVEPDDKASLGY